MAARKPRPETSARNKTTTTERKQANNKNLGPKPRPKPFVKVSRDDWWLKSLYSGQENLRARIDSLMAAMLAAEANGRRLDILTAALQRRIDALETEIGSRAVRNEQERDARMQAANGLNATTSRE